LLKEGIEENEDTIKRSYDIEEDIEDKGYFSKAKKIVSRFKPSDITISRLMYSCIIIIKI
jgi:hypothetical protein